MIVSRTDNSISWRPDDEGAFQRTSHAISDKGQVWIVDPVDTEEIHPLLTELGTPAGVVVLMDRHLRDAEQFAHRYQIPMWVPQGRMRQDLSDTVQRYGHDIPRSPFVVVNLYNVDFVWLESALWWAKEKVLICGDALGTTGYFVLGDERLGVHPLLRLTPPAALRRLRPKRILCGHGDPVEINASAALKRALEQARTQIPKLVVDQGMQAATWLLRRAKMPL